MQKEIDRQKEKAVAAMLTSGLLEVVTSRGMGLGLVSTPYRRSYGRLLHV